MLIDDRARLAAREGIKEITVTLEEIGEFYEFSGFDLSKSMRFDKVRLIVKE